MTFSRFHQEGPWLAVCHKAGVTPKLARLEWHARSYWLLLAEGHLTRRLFGDMLRKIWALPVPGG